MIVLTAAPPYPEWGNIPDNVKAKLDQVQQDMQKELTGLSSNSTQILATTNNHVIHFDQPQLVIEAILKLVNAARNM